MPARHRAAASCRLSVTAVPSRASGAAPVVALAVLLAGGSPAPAPAQTPPAAGAGRVLVMPFENTSKQARLAWMGEGASILLTDNSPALASTY